MTSQFMFSYDFSQKNSCFNPFAEIHAEIRQVESTGKWNARELTESALRLKSDQTIARGELQESKSENPDFLKGSVVIIDRAY